LIGGEAADASAHEFAVSTPLYPSSRHDRPHARLYDHDLNHAAWSTLGCGAFKLLVYLLADYRPERPNSFPVGERRVALMIGVSEATAAKAVNELIEKGHLRLERRGRNYGRVATRERIVSLTRHDTETVRGDPELPIKLWRKRQADAPELGG
jgi:DNA-binding MarR family transcriptional regulator